LITRADEGVVVLVVDDVVVVVGVPEDGEMARTIRNVPPPKSRTIISTTARGG
jgi:hypothetical protein